VFDFELSDLIDSSAIGALVSLTKELKESSGRLILKNLGEDFYQMFIDTGLDRVFTIERGGGVQHAYVDLFESSVDIRLGIEKEFTGDVCIFAMSGVMNYPMGSVYFKQQFLLALEQNKKILLDFEDLTFFDSLSIGAVLNMNNLLKGTGGSMRICSANYIVNDLLTTLSIDQIIPIFDTRDKALEGWDIHYG
jgi:anti-anti-sigma factor